MDQEPTRVILNEGVNISPKELTRAKDGVADFKNAFAHADLKGKYLLRWGSFSSRLQSMFLGLKPATDLLPHELNAYQNSSIRDIFPTANRLIYRPDLVEEVIAAHPDAFQDYKDFPDLKSYMESRTKTLTHLNEGSEQILRAGLLFGYPEDAVSSYAHYYPKVYGPFVTGLHQPPGFSLMSLALDKKFPSMSQLEKQIVLLFLMQNLKGGPLSAEEVNKFKDEHQEEIKEFIKKVKPRFTEDQVNYIASLRVVDVKDFSYGAGNPTQRDKEFPGKVKQIYKGSGMDAFLNKTGVPLTWPFVR